MNLNENHLRVLKALRGASVLRREPGTLTPDGHSRCWTLLELAQQGRLRADPEAASAASTLRKNRLVAGRTLFSVLRYSLTNEGYLLLAAHEAAHGLSDIVAAELEMEQASEDIAQAQRRLAQASERHRAALLAHMEQAGEAR